MAQSPSKTEEQSFTPALGYPRLTPLYDVAIASLTRERIWRDALVHSIRPTSGDRILDVGCGTGSLALKLKKLAPSASVFGLDPDPQVLARASKKAQQDSLVVDWREGFLTAEFVTAIRPMNKVVSSLVLHQTPVDEKRRILALIGQVLEPGGTLHIADYGLQRTTLMRTLFRRTVQAIDGTEDTAPNADGKLLEYMREAGFESVAELKVVPTPTGSISIYRAQSPMNGGVNAPIR